MQTNRDLTVFEAAAIVTGFGVGGGVMAVPYLASLTGIVPLLIVLVLAFLFSAVFHLMLAEMMLRDASAKQLVEIFSKYLFRGKRRVLFTWIFFGLVFVAFIANLSAYIAGGGEILRDLLSIPLWTGHILTYVVAAGVVFFGLKMLGLSEKFAVLGMLLVVGVLTVKSLALPYHAVGWRSTGYREPLALFGMVMFSLTAIFSVPQAAEGLKWKPTLLPKAVILGLALNLLIIASVTLMAMGVSTEVTRVAITGWSKALGTWAFIFGSLFVFLAMLTSYRSISFALAAAS